MARPKKPIVVPSDEQIRGIMLRYFYDRNKNATSMMGKKGSAVRTSDLKSELKATHGLSQQQVQSNLTYLLSQGWVEEKPISKTFTPKGQCRFISHELLPRHGGGHRQDRRSRRMDKFHGIKIEATGQNIITVGDGNQVDAKFGNIAEGLAELRNAIIASDVRETDKLTYVADIETIQSQLAKPTPNRTIIRAAWATVKGAAAINGCSTLVAKIVALIGQFIP